MKLTELSYKLKSLHTLSLAQFMQALIEGDLSVLGDAPEEILQTHWQELSQKFSDSILTDEGKHNISMEGRVVQLEAMKMLIQSVAEYAFKYKDERLFAVLRENGYDRPYTDETMEDDMQFVDAGIKRFTIMQDQIKVQLQKNSENGAAMDYDYFASILNSISAMVKFNVDESITVTRFCNYYTQLIKHIEKQDISG